MANYIEAKISRLTQSETGNQKQVKEVYLIKDAYTLSEAEKKLMEELSWCDDLTVLKMALVKYNEVIPSSNEEDDTWYKFRVAFITFGEHSSKEKKTTVPMLVQAADNEDAFLKLKAFMRSSATDWNVVSIAETSIVDLV